MFMLGTVELPVTADVGASMSEGIMLVAGVIGVAVGGFVLFVFIRQVLSLGKKILD